MRRRGGSNAALAAAGFLAPNLAGFLVFTLFPVLFSFWMAFTNWTPKPAVHLQFLGLRNFTDLLGVRALAAPRPLLPAFYVLSAVAIMAGLTLALFANAGAWRGTRLGGVLFALLGAAAVCMGGAGAGSGAALAGLALLACGIAALIREGHSWAPGIGTAPALLTLLGAAGIALLSHRMCAAYEPRDPSFWQYAYNTLYLMAGIPLSIAASLGLALAVNDDLPLGAAKQRLAGALLCALLAAFTLALVWVLGHPDMAVMLALLWAVAALGFAFNVVAFRTLFYLPTFTAGVALMILWQALYNPQTGPIDAGLRALLALLRVHAHAPQWLASVAWAKPALIVMGIWTAMGGTNMLLYLAALSNVPQELLDAAHVDGAGAWSRFCHVTWPQLAPTTFFISVMSIIGGLQGGFEQARVMTGGGPAGSTTTLSYYIYNKAFEDLNLGYAAAISWVLFAAVFAATAINWRFGRGLEVE